MHIIATQLHAQIALHRCAHTKKCVQNAYIELLKMCTQCMHRIATPLHAHIAAHQCAHTHVHTQTHPPAAVAVAAAPPSDSAIVRLDRAVCVCVCVCMSVCVNMCVRERLKERAGESSEDFVNELH